MTESLSTLSLRQRAACKNTDSHRVQMARTASTPGAKPAGLRPCAERNTTLAGSSAHARARRMKKKKKKQSYSSTWFRFFLFPRLWTGSRAGVQTSCANCLCEHGAHSPAGPAESARRLSTVKHAGVAPCNARVPGDVLHAALARVEAPRRRD